MDDLGGKVAAIACRCQPDRVSPVGAAWRREVHVRHLLVDYRRHCERRRACVRRVVQYFLHPVTEQGERYRSVREEMSKTASFAHVLRPV